MAVVIKSEKPADPPKFVRLVYKTCVLGSLNSKRSSCQQAASDCVKATRKRSRPTTLFRWHALQALSISNPRRKRGVPLVHRFTAGMCVWENSVGFQEEVTVKNIRCQVWQHQRKHRHRLWWGVCNTTLRELHWQMDYKVPQSASSRCKGKKDYGKIHKEQHWILWIWRLEWGRGDSVQWVMQHCCGEQE